MNFVLVHGGFHGGWCWRLVADRLRALGHRVSHPTSTGFGERRHLLRADLSLDVLVLDLVNHLQAEELTDVVLVGHSFGGLSISGAADRVPQRIRQLVFLDSLILQPGQTVFGALPPEVVAQRRQSCAQFDGVRCFPAPPVTAFGIPPEHPDAAWVERRLTPQPESLYDSPLALANPVGNGLPSTYIACTNPALPAVASSQAWARAQPGWRWMEMDTGHDVMVTEPQRLARLLVEMA